MQTHLAGYRLFTIDTPAGYPGRDRPDEGVSGDERAQNQTRSRRIHDGFEARHHLATVRRMSA